MQVQFAVLGTTRYILQTVAQNIVHNTDQETYPKEWNILKEEKKEKHFRWQIVG